MLIIFSQEAALAKLAHVLSLDLSYEEKREMLARSLCGEMTVHIKKESTEPAKELQMIAAVAREMNLSSSVEVAELREVLFPCLICSAVYKNNFDIIDACFKEGADISAGKKIFRNHFSHIKDIHSVR